MKPLDIKAASSLFKVSRSTIYAKIEKGELSRRADKKLDFVELVRVFGEPSNRLTKHERTQEKLDTIRTLKDTKQENTNPGEQEAALLARIRKLEDDLQHARDREKWLQGQFDKLTDTVKLLNAPKPDTDEKTPKKQGFFGRVFGK
ncbi:plasmid replication DNA-binding protein [Hydromonas duriensis]|uniref:DNA-binding protein n=1 Tax=Hydromonas duriensis TaxID=1527608 RepID=A0A4R6Y3V2_9BURK|nr:plasmid replication DNA-binding protein [Hydromonas duriensis]TDR27734.1 hypothetical protein DFR44_1428 [Hydromonas duriensis]